MWYAIGTEVGQEEAVKQQIETMMPKNAGGNCFILRCVKKKRYLGQWHDKRELFLPGYVFWVTETSEKNCFLKELNQCVEICSIKQEEEKFLRKLTAESDEIGMSYGVIRNNALNIYDGVLMGMESRVKKIDRHKRKGFIVVRIHSEEKMAEIGLEITEKIYTPQDICCYKEIDNSFGM